MALTYTEVFTLRRLALDTLLLEHPEIETAVYRAGRRITLQRALLKYMTKLMGKRGPSSFIMKSMSSGVESVEDRLSVEQKVDVTVAKVDQLQAEIAAQKRKADEDIGEIKAMLQALVRKSET